MSVSLTTSRGHVAVRSRARSFFGGTLGVRRPAHHSEAVEQGLGDGGGYFPDAQKARNYAAKAVESDYGKDRVRAVTHLFAKAGVAPTPTVVDF